MMFNHRTTEKRLTALLDALREGKPYTVEYDESLASALECRLLDIWRTQELQNARSVSYTHLTLPTTPYV